MLTKLFFPAVSGVRVDQMCWDGAHLHLSAHTTRRAARCPLCGRRSKRVHSRYWRTLADLPCMGAVVTVHLWTRRFVCRVRWCRRKIFTERLPTLVDAWARRTGRLRDLLQRTGLALGGAPGARYATAAGLPVSRRTLLRLVRAVPTPGAGPVHILGVDDWAYKRGRSYGTILVNLETHTVIDLLPDRTAATLAAWLRQHPEVDVVSRDRAEAYAEGIRQGAPQALQVADRFHLLKNVTESVERFLKRKHAALRHAAQEVTSAPAPPTATPSTGPQEPRSPGVADRTHAEDPARRLTRHEQDQQACRVRRLARYEEVMTLHEQGHSLRSIAQATGVCRNTVRRYIRAEGFPECQPRRRHSRVLAPFVAYLQERWTQGCQNARALYAEVCQRGYRGGYTTLTDYLRAWRPARRCAGQRITARARAATSVYSARQTLWLLLRPEGEGTVEEQAYLTCLYHTCPAVYLAQALAQEFATVLREHDVDGLYAWLRRTETCPIKELQAVARSMWLDKRAIEAAVALEWSNGQVEGSVNKLKVFKRAMFGRARFDLLRQRVLHAA